MRKVKDLAGIRPLLVLLRQSEDPNVHIEHRSGDWLHVGIRGWKAFVIYHSANPQASSMSASTSLKVKPESKEYFEFLVGEVSTPIPKDRCLSIDSMVGVVEHFAKTGKLKSSVRWIVD